MGQSGNWHSFTKADGDKIPKGEYILEINDEWKAGSNAAGNTDLKKQTLRIASPVKVAFENVTHKQAIRTLSMGKADWVQKATCPSYTTRSMGKGKSLSEYAVLAKAAGATQFMYSLDQQTWDAYWCKDSEITAKSNADWGNLMDIYKVNATP